MPRYRFTGWAEHVLTGLIHGVNAELHRGKHGQPEGSTVVVQPGDEVTTEQPYPHALLTDVETGKPGVEQPKVEPTIDATAATAASADVPPGAAENTGGESTTQPVDDHADTHADEQE